MSNNNGNHDPYNDKTGEVISWVVVFILLVAFWPVGILLLLRKLRGYASPTSDYRKDRAQAAQAARRPAAQSSGSTRYSAAQSSGSARQTAAQATEAARQAAAKAQSAARQATSELRQTVREASGTARQAVSDAQKDFSYDFSYTPRTTAKKEKRTPLEKKTGKFISVVMLLISIPMLIFSATGIARAVQSIVGNGVSSWYELIMGLFFFIGGLLMIFTRNIGVRRIARFKKYYSYAIEHDIVPIADLALVTGQSAKAVARDLQAMINNRYFGPKAYIDNELDSLVLSPAAAKEARRAARGAAKPAAEASQSAEKPENQYMAIILELRDLNDTIADIEISDRIDRIEELTAKIFRIVEENPEKLPEIRRFMNYYLPTTLKLLYSYATLEKQGIKGENITAAKENISRILETLATGYEQQLDQLFKSDAIDIAADINVLENMMQQDGLTGDRPEFKTMESGW